MVREEVQAAPTSRGGYCDSGYMGISEFSAKGSCGTRWAYDGIHNELGWCFISPDLSFLRWHDKYHARTTLWTGKSGTRAIYAHGYNGRNNRSNGNKSPNFGQCNQTHVHLDMGQLFLIHNCALYDVGQPLRLNAIIYQTGTGYSNPPTAYFAT